MKVNKLAFLFAAFLMIAACGEKNNPVTPDNGNDNQENVTPTPEPAELNLTFDFTNAEAMSDWPKDLVASEDPTVQFTCPYVLNGVTYNFISSQPREVTSTNWPYFSESESALVIPKQRFLGFPVLADCALTKVAFTVNTTTATYSISTELGVGTADVILVSGGEGQSNSEATEFTFNLTGTQVGTQYWLKVAGKAPRMTSLTLTYVK